MADPLHSTEHLFDEAWASTNKELAGDSDRAAAIVGCALLDDRLGALHTEFFVQNQDGWSELLNSDDSNAPLGSFGARIVAAYAVGLIDQTQRDALRRLKKVRNAFAHKTGLSFADQAITAHCEAAAKLCPTTSIAGQQHGTRELFQHTVALLAGRIAEHRYLIQTFGLKGTFDAVFKAAVARDREGTSAG
ncbi:MAG: hypothetical protein AB1806_00790 [Acidobacteriota bacterium]